MGDQNPIPYLILTVALRFWLSLILIGQSAITGTDLNFLNWFTLFAFGTVADFPLVANIILFLITDGTLVLWLALLIKRLANPVAN